MCEVPHLPFTTTNQVWGLYFQLLSKKYKRKNARRAKA